MSANVHLVRAPNPSALTLSGTNSYLIDCGNGEAACIDPGPPIERHVSALIERAGAMHCRIGAIAVTHGHPDHAPAAQRLAERTGAPVFAHRNAAFPHDRSLSDRDPVRCGDTALVAVDAPGHTFDHLVFYDAREGALFTGDVVLGEGYVVIAPPGGSMRAYQQTLRRLATEFPDARTIYGGHGEPVGDPASKLADYIAHREHREREVIDALASGPRTIPELVRSIYAQTPKALWPAAARQLLAYLIALENEGRIRSHELDRPLDPAEQALLNPEWSTVVGAQHAAVVESELGSMLRIERLRAYARVD